MTKNVAGVVVLYNPEPVVVDNIQTYYASVEKLYVIDNTEHAAKEIIDEISRRLPNAEYIPFNENLGIAKALNEAATRAIQEGFEWILTMDQDSSASAGMVENLLKVTSKVKHTMVGIIAPQYIDDPIPSASNGNAVEEALTTITSGNLLNLVAFSDVGPFREELFIDFVDIDYCLRLNLKGYKVLISNQVKLEHQLGSASCHSFFGRRLCTSNHNYIRRYYITRNRLAILKEYKNVCPDFYQSEKNKNFIEITKLILFEKNKLKKIKSILEGYIDFKRNKFGKYH